MSIAPRVLVAWVLCVAAIAGAQAAAPRPLNLDDWHRIEDLAEPSLSPDGRSVAYSVTRDHVELDERVSDVWLADVTGRSRRALTHTPADSEWLPRFSPDGRWIAFLSTRGDANELAQVWLLPRAGGEAEKLTDLPGGVSDYIWSPDSRRLALIALDADPELAVPEAERKPQPLVIDRYQFKEDGTGFLGALRSHLYAFSLEARTATLLTPGAHDESLPAWSPDGKAIAYVTKRGDDPDRHLNYDIYLVDPDRPGAERQLTTFKGSDLDPYWESRPAWSPDSRRIAYLRSGEDKWIYYAPWELAVVDTQGGEESQPVRLDRNVTKPLWSSDGSAVYAIVEESRNSYLTRFDLRSGKVLRLTRGARFDMDFVLDDERVVLLSSDDAHPARLSALDLRGRRERALAGHNQWLADVALRPQQDIEFNSPDGRRIEGFLVLPPGASKDQPVPAILRLHGGPVYQFSHEFMFDWQLFAAHGFAVIAPNPRGSSGRGFDFSRAIYAAWGGVDKDDVLAAVDHVLAQGVVDAKRLGVGGWSYGGILTDLVIAQDARFAAAISGAGSASALATWGTDQYVREYTLELGTPWGNTEAYLRASYALLHADRIRTPTLFMVGQEDFNVPLIGSEQLYQALRVLDVPTQLVIYPDSYHGIDRPSFARDKLQRYLDWYAKYLARNAP